MTETIHEITDAQREQYAKARAAEEESRKRARKIKGSRRLRSTIPHCGLRDKPGKPTHHRLVSAGPPGLLRCERCTVIFRVAEPSTAVIE